MKKIIAKVIYSCKTFDQLESCSEWVIHMYRKPDIENYFEKKKLEYLIYEMKQYLTKKNNERINL